MTPILSLGEEGGSWERVRPTPILTFPLSGGRDSDWVLAITTSHHILAFHLKLVLLFLLATVPNSFPHSEFGEGVRGAR